MLKSSVKAHSLTMTASVAARAAALSLLFMQAGLHIGDFADVRWLAAACVLAAVLGAIAARVHLRFLPALVLSVIVPFALRALAVTVMTWVIGPGIDPDHDAFFRILDSNFVPFWPAFSYSMLASFLYLKFPRFASLEPLANAFLLAAAFASQAQYRITLYPHPVILASVVALFLAFEALALFLLSKSERPDAAPRPWSLLFAVLPLALMVMLFLLGGYSEGAVRQGGGLIKPTLFKFDFSDYLSLESEISLGNDLVLLVKKDPENPAYLLRRYVLNAYSPGKGFHREAIDGVSSHPDSTPAKRTSWSSPGYGARIPLEQEYYIINFDSRAFIAMNVPLEAVPYEVPRGSGFQSVYRVVSDVPTLASPMTLESSGDAAQDESPFPLSGEITESSYARLTDYGNDDRIRELALSVTEGITGYYDRALAVNDYLKTGYRYSLKPGVAPDGNQLAYFLFTSRKGYCSYFAFSMALMMRSLGMPCRVAVGFFLSPDNEILGVHPVRANMAHAWVEVWFPEAGWIEFDPTSETMADGEAPPSGAEDDSERLIRLIQELFSRRGNLVEANGEDEAARDPGTTGNAFLDSAVDILLKRWPLLAAAAFACMLYFRRAALLLSLTFARDPRRKAQLRFLRLEASIASLGMPRGLGESRSEWAKRIEAGSRIPLKAVETVYARSMWAERFTEADLELFMEAEKNAAKTARKNAGALRALFSFLFGPGYRGKKP